MVRALFFSAFEDVKTEETKKKRRTVRLIIE